MAIPGNLRIAFFGSDVFSVASLSRLCQLQQQKPTLISSLDVITRSIKPTGRNLKQLVDVPVGTFATARKLNLHRADNSEGILQLLAQNEFDLAVAVSYGKLIPEQFLSQMKYGGLNVHPSLLPMYSGSSPIQYAIMEDRKNTGVTVQTLHPTKFDHGEIVLQSLPVPIAENDKFSDLQARLSLLGAEMLAKVISEGLYNEPLNYHSNFQFSLASKILPKMAQINWQTPSRKIKRLADALGPLHTYKYVDITKKKRKTQEFQKVILDDIQEIPSCTLQTPGEFQLQNGSLVMKTIDGAISAGQLKFQCCGEEDPSTFMKLLEKRAGNTPNIFKHL